MAITRKDITKVTNPFAFFEPRGVFPDNWFPDVDRFFARPAFAFWPRREEFEFAWVPELDVFERDNHLTVRLGVPGLKKEEIAVTVAEGVLTIEGERKHETEETENNWHKRERSYGKFFRTVPLPEGVKESEVTATLKDGVLEITVPTPVAAVEEPPHKVEVRGAEGKTAPKIAA